MIIRLRTRPQTLLQAIVRPHISPVRSRCRTYHKVPELAATEEGRKEKEEWTRIGIPGFLSREAYTKNWLSYQQYLCDYLNQKTQGTTLEGGLARDLACKVSHDPANAALFNHASMAANNHIFFNTLRSVSKLPAERANISLDVKSGFGSFDNLRLEMLESAEAMFGNGFVWLMKVPESAGGRLRILCTYNAGSPFPDAHHRRQSVDMSTYSPQNRRIAERLTTPQNRVGAFGNSSINAEPGYANALRAEPILCINNWQHMWIPDYGLFGKRTYLSAWWERIDWDQVEMNLMRAAGSAGSSWNKQSSSIADIARESMRKNY